MSTSDCSKKKDPCKCGDVQQLCQKGFFSRRQWRRRYCVIAHGVFYSYEPTQPRDLTKPKCIFPVNTIERIAEDDHNKSKQGHHIFIVTTARANGKDRDHFFFSTTTRDEMLDWIQALTGIDITGLQNVKPRPMDPRPSKSKLRTSKTGQVPSPRNPFVSSKSLGEVEATLEISRDKDGERRDVVSELQLKTVSKRSTFSHKKCASEERSIKVPHSYCDDTGRLEQDTCSTLPLVVAKCPEYDSVYEDVAKCTLPPDSYTTSKQFDISEPQTQLQLVDASSSLVASASLSPENQTLCDLICQNETLMQRIAKIEAKLMDFPRIQQQVTSLNELVESLRLKIDSHLDQNSQAQGEEYHGQDDSSKCSYATSKSSIKSRRSYPLGSFPVDCCHIEHRRDIMMACNTSDTVTQNSVHYKIEPPSPRDIKTTSPSISLVTNDNEEISFIDRCQKIGTGKVLQEIVVPSRTLSVVLPQVTESNGTKMSLESSTESINDTKAISASNLTPSKDNTNKRFYPVSRQLSTPNLPTRRSSSEADYSIRRQHSLGIVPEEGSFSVDSHLSSKLVVDQTLPLSPSESLTSVRSSASASRRTSSITESQPVQTSSDVILGSSLFYNAQCDLFPPATQFHEGIQYASTSSLID